MRAKITGNRSKMRGNKNRATEMRKQNEEGESAKQTKRRVKRPQKKSEREELVKLSDKRQSNSRKRKITLVD